MSGRVPPIEERWADVAGIRTRYLEAGRGEPMVLVHGGVMGEPQSPGSAEDWRENLLALAQTNRVIAVDRLGQGRTDNPVRDPDWSIAGSVSHLAEFVRAIGAHPCHVVGHDTGGYVAARLALDHSPLVISCTIVASATAAPGMGRGDIVLALNPHEPGSAEALRYTVERSVRGGASIDASWLAAMAETAASSKMQDATRRMQGDGLAASQYYPGLLEQREQLFARIRAEGVARPVLLYWGYNDPISPFQQGLRLYELMADKQHRVQFHAVNEAGHYPFRERPEEFACVVAEFAEGASHGE